MELRFVKDGERYWDVLDEHDSRKGTIFFSEWLGEFAFLVACDEIELDGYSLETVSCFLKMLNTRYVLNQKEMVN